ncbi:MAG: outer membrane beta-barrel protein, partial [Bdellovibrionales bacterium]
MKKLSVSLIALALALVAAPNVHAAQTTPGWYAAAGVGVAFPLDADIRAGGVERKAKTENAALDLLAGAGYAFDNGLRLEAEYFHNQVDVKSVNGVAGGGHVTNNVLFFNALYDIDTNSMLTPYIGAGVGPDFVDVDNVGTTGAYLNGDKVVGAYQAIAGVTAKMDMNWAITADYRYVGSFDPKVDYTGGTKGRIENASHNIIVGLRYSFGAEETI